MTKKHEILSLVLVILFGSIITFYSSNMLMSDLSNMFYGVHDAYIIASFPLFFISIDFVIGLIFIIRFCRYPQYRKALVNLYTLLLLIVSIIGFIFSILTGTLIYHSFTTRYPFIGYTTITLLIHIMLAFLALYIRKNYLKKLPEDTEKKKLKVKYCLYSALLGFMIYFAFTKFGAFLYAPFYIHWRTFNLTFTFYLSLLMPIALVIHVILYFMDAYKGREKLAIFVVGSILCLSIILCSSVLIIGATQTQFISAVSPALPLERLATKPINSIFMLVALVIFGMYYLLYAIKSYIRANKKD